MTMLALVGLGLVQFLWPATFSAVKSERVCKDIYLLGAEVSFSANELVFLCGSDEGFEGWREIPLVQARYHLRLFLQERGYMSPRFEVRGQQLFVYPGTRTKVRAVRTEGRP